MAEAAVEPIQCSLFVSVPPARAFELFVDCFGRWWPIAYTYGEVEFETAIIEKRVGGRWYETKLDGSEADWGKVRGFEPGRGLVLSFGVSAERKPEPPARHSEVAIRFVPEGDGTRLELEHRDIARHGDGAEALRKGLASREGWPLILAEFGREARHAA